VLGSGEGAKYVAWTLAEQGKLHWKETPELQEALARRADALRTKVRRKLREGRESRVKLLLINLHYENARSDSQRSPAAWTNRVRSCSVM
jgi:hypothetical protein